MYKVYRVIVTAIVFCGLMLLSWNFTSAVDLLEFEGEGTKENPYQIATPEQLDLVRQHLDKHFIQVADIDLSEYLSSGGAGYNDGYGWEPIGISLGNAFIGTYDGQGYTISNLAINRSNQDHIGLFGYVGNNTTISFNIKVTIKRIGLLDVNINGNDFVGGLVGTLQHGEIHECYVTGDVVGTGFRVGGLVGSNNRRVENSYSKASVTGSSMVGGLVGANVSTSARVINCYSVGRVARVGTIGLVGGLIGYNEPNVSVWINSYYNSNTSEQSDTGKGFGRTTADMKKKSTYENWNFDAAEDSVQPIWHINEEINDGYPYLMAFLKHEEVKGSNSSLAELYLYVIDDYGTKSLAEIMPEFAKEQHHYSAIVTESVYQVKLRVLPEDEKATIIVNEDTIDIDGLSRVIPLEIGTNDIVVVVIAEDNESSQHYVLIVTRIEDNLGEPGEKNPEPGDPEPTEPEPTETEPSNPEPSNPEPSNPEPSNPEPSDPEPIDPGPSDSEPSDPGPSDPEPFDPEPTESEPELQNGYIEEDEKLDSNLLNLEQAVINLIRIQPNMEATLIETGQIVINLDELINAEQLVQLDYNAIIHVSILHSSQTIVTLSGSMTKFLIEKRTKLHIETANSILYFPLDELNNIDISLEHLQSLNFEINDASEKIEILAADAEIINPVEFLVYVNLDSSTEIQDSNQLVDVKEINQFNVYIARDIKMPSDWGFEQVGTGVYITDTGEYYHVPTTFYEADGVKYARILSLTNSIYGLLVVKSSSFVDMIDHWAYESVKNLTDRQILKGINIDGELYFEPNRNITRAEFVTILTRAVGLHAGKQYSHSNLDYTSISNPQGVMYVDIDEKDWFEHYIRLAKTNNLINGYNDQTFRPLDYITREQAVVILYNAKNFVHAKTSSGQKINYNGGIDYSASTDIDKLMLYADAKQISSWSIEAFRLLVSEQLIKGYEGKLHPKNNLTRAQAAVLIERLLEYIKLTNN
ncbi:S-layer homology domain-containing protein [Desulfuribacillus alkaliarsenatis]|uniref:SLH domain-containing protein n=1 Tax=Desulfuribacillus alkaliarsenatis TaxID=766136 RepID=A0A1E5G3H3_9FIRM|nr:S-layer homology domain-containing protein [Desulfuribacillus alkaliarsenatis]OEF97639.1 hypothetical protein BHF68_14425 [Desulfuribacillus alkaliarsenatis]